MPALRAVHPAAERNVVRTADLLRDEAEVLDVVVDTALAGRDRDRRSIDLAALPPALARLVVRRLAERATGALCARAPPGALDDVVGARRRRVLDLGDGARAVVDGGVLRCERTPRLPARLRRLRAACATRTIGEILVQPDELQAARPRARRGRSRATTRTATCCSSAC